MPTNDQSLIYEAYADQIVSNASDSEEYSIFIEAELTAPAKTSKAIQAFENILKRYDRNGAIALTPGGVYTRPSGDKTVVEYDAYIKRGRRYIDPEEDNSRYLPSYIESAISDLYDGLEGYNSTDDIELEGDDGEPPEHVSSFEIPGERVTIRYVLSY
jgi:hypothetical protein